MAAKKKSGVSNVLKDEFQLSSVLDGRKEKETNPSKSRRTVEDLLEIKRYKAMHEDYYELEEV